MKDDEIETIPEEYNEVVGNLLINELDKMEYNFWKGLRKGLLAVLLVGVPVVLQALPQEWMNLTLGGLLVMAINFAKVKYSSL